MLAPEQWHAHFLYQAKWTEEVRGNFFKNWSGQNLKILEVGCGTGAIIGSMVLKNKPILYGLDYTFEFLEHCSKNRRQINLTCANAHQLPFCDGAFDITFCHFLLLWLKNPLIALKEMVRVTRKGGWVAAFAEPDHAARIDYPISFEKAGKAQAVSLQRQGADLQSGRKLVEWMIDCGLQHIEVGILGAHWMVDRQGECSEEARMLEHDLKWLSDDEKRDVGIKQSSNEYQKSVIFIPTFYAWGQVQRK
jgi:ubiquinone/menaquinone biosynthesis C-methylase UbiE